MKETKLTKDQYGNIKVQSLEPNQYFKAILHKTNKVNEKEFNKQDGTSFKVYSIICMHDGEEVWLRMTPAVAREVGKANTGDVITVTAVKSKLKGGKAYSVEIEEGNSSSPDISELELKALNTVNEYMIKNNKTPSDFTDEEYFNTFALEFGLPEDRARLLIQKFKDTFKN